MPRREFLQLAKKFDEVKSKIAGWMLSEKLDGSRCFWDGGISRGMRTVDVPYSSLINPKKQGERKKKIKPVATGLWSRYGNPIMAPDWFLDKLPAIPLDGELWAGRGNFQLCRSIVAGDEPDPRFKQVKYAVYSMPGARVWESGEIKNSNFHRIIDETCMDLVNDNAVATAALFTEYTFEEELRVLNNFITDDPEASCYIHKQIRLPEDEAAARVALDSFMDGVIDRGGEGVIIRNPKGLWTPRRVNDLLKYKPIDDDEGILTGFTSGRKTNKGSKHLGKIGALILDYNGKRLELSGLTDEEREFAGDKEREYAKAHPGEYMFPSARAKNFNLGERITFKYRELSDDGIPKEARYFRNRGKVK